MAWVRRIRKAALSRGRPSLAGAVAVLLVARRDRPRPRARRIGPGGAEANGKYRSHCFDRVGILPPAATQQLCVMPVPASPALQSQMSRRLINLLTLLSLLLCVASVALWVRSYAASDSFSHGQLDVDGDFSDVTGWGIDTGEGG